MTMKNRIYNKLSGKCWAADTKSLVGKKVLALKTWSLSYATTYVRSGKENVHCRNCCCWPCLQSFKNAIVFRPSAKIYYTCTQSHKNSLLFVNIAHTNRHCAALSRAVVKRGNNLWHVAHFNWNKAIKFVNEK